MVQPRYNPCDYSGRTFGIILNMCRNAIRCQDAESAVKTIYNSRHGDSQSGDTCRHQHHQTTMTFLKRKLKVENVLSAEKKKYFNLNQDHCSKKSNMLESDNFFFISYLKFFLLHACVFAWHVPTKFGKLFTSQLSPMMRSSSSYSQSSFPLRFILLTIGILSGKNFQHYFRLTYKRFVEI